MKVTTKAAALVGQGAIPSYPSAPPGVDDSGRTGTLGRSLGVAQTGGIIGQAQIFTFKRLGQASYEAAIGTRVKHAESVIGANQKPPWIRYWWNINTWLKIAQPKIIKLYENTMQQLVNFLEGRR